MEVPTQLAGSPVICLRIVSAAEIATWTPEVAKIMADNAKTKRLTKSVKQASTYSIYWGPCKLFRYVREAVGKPNFEQEKLHLMAWKIPQGVVYCRYLRGSGGVNIRIIIADYKERVH